MNKGLIFTIFIGLFGVVASSFASPYVEWVKTFGSGGGYCVYELKDDGFIVSAIKREINKSEIYIIRTDKNGDTLWTRTYGDTLISQCFVVKIRDEGFLAEGSNNNNTYLIRIDSMGNTLWTKTYCGWSYMNSVCQTPDNGFMIAGGSCFVAKLDSCGDTLWTKWYWEVGEIYVIKQTVKNGFIMVGTNQISGNSMEGVLARIDSSGDSLWTYNYGEPGWDVFRCGTQTSDSGFIATGYTDRNPPVGNDDIWLLRADKNGNEMWDTTFGLAIPLYDWGFWVEETFDSGFIITGRKEYSDMDLWLIRTDKNGHRMWDTTFSGISGSLEQGFCVKQTSDSGFIVTGVKMGNIVLIKMGKDVGIEENKKLRVESTELRVEGKRIYLEMTDARDVELRVYDLSGREREVVYEGMLGAGKYTFGAKVPGAGVYFIKLETGNYRTTQKLILIK